MSTNMIGSYGPWAAGSFSDRERTLSLLSPKWRKTESWRQAAREKVSELLAGPQITAEVCATVQVGRRYAFEDLEIEELTWQLPYGPETEAIFMKPAGKKGPLPGVLALHDHAGVKYFGKQKIIRTSPNPHPSVEQHQRMYYGGEAWANALARRGYGVLVFDVFPFESRKIRAAELPAHVVERMMSAPGEVRELTPQDLEESRVVSDYEVDGREESGRIERYNAFAAQHEHIIAKSLFSAGYTWPGVFVAEDRIALDVLYSRADIDSERIGCCGLSLGGLRTDYLAGLDDRIQCSVTVCFMTTWRDLVLNNCYTHTWMVYIPLLSRYMDFPEVLGMRAPRPSLILATEEDPLFSLEEVKQALSILERIYAKAGAPRSLAWSIYPGPHCFNRSMQAEAFDWLDRFLAEGANQSPGRSSPPRVFS